MFPQVVFSQSTTTTLTVDPSYNIGAGTIASGSTNKLAVQSDGKVVLLGNFNMVGGVSRSNIARINADGTTDTSFNPGTGFSQPFIASAVKIQSDGKIIAAGQFSMYNGTPRSSIVRINTDGSLDTTFNTGTGTTMPPSTIEVQADGKIIVMGYGLTTYNGSPVNHIFRLNTDGTLDSSFVAKNFTSMGFISLSSLKIQSVGGVEKILVGGYFTNYDGTLSSSIVRLNSDGSIDTSFTPQGNVTGNVSGIEVTSNGNVVLLGGGAYYNGMPRQGVIILTPTGAIDTNFNSSGAGPTMGGNSTSPNNMVVRPDGKILISGMFTEYNGTAINGLALLNSDGTLDSGFNPNLGFGGNSPSTIALSGDGGFLLGGYFTTYNGTSLNGGFLKVDQTGALATTFMANTSVMFAFTPSVVLKQADDKIIIAGNFNLVDGVSKNYIARFNTDGSLDTTFNNGGVGPNGSVQAVSIQPNGKILIGGYFMSYNGTSRQGIARLNTDGTLDTTFTPGTGFTSNGMIANIYSLETLSTGKILVGGASFSNFDGNAVTNKNLIRLNADGTFDNTFNPTGVGVNTNMVVGVNIIREQADGKIIIGGGFSSYNGTNANGLLRLNADGTVDTSFTQSWGAGAGLNMGGTARFLIIQPNDNKIIVAGTLSSYNGTSRTNILRLNTDGTLDTSFNAGTAGTLSWPMLATDGKLLIPGTFTSFNGTTINRLVRLNTDGTVDTSFTPGSTGASGTFSPSAPARISHVLEQTDGKLLVVGNFSSYNGTARNVIVRLNPVVTSTLSVLNTEKKQLTIYPNPAKNFVTISNIKTGSVVELYDMTGQLLKTTKAFGNSVTLDTTNYQNGMYLVKVDGQTSKLLISK